MVTNTSLARPILFGIMGLKGGSVANINMINPPNWFQFVANSSDLIFDNLNLTAKSLTKNPAKNSGMSCTPFSHVRGGTDDGIELINEQMDGISNARIPSSSRIPSSQMMMIAFLSSRIRRISWCRICTALTLTVSRLAPWDSILVRLTWPVSFYATYHTHTHTPSLDQEDMSRLLGWSSDFMTENLYIYNATMTTSGDAARIKVFGGNIPANNSTSSGGGTGLVRNVTYDTIFDEGCDCKLPPSPSFQDALYVKCLEYADKMRTQMRSN